VASKPSVGGFSGGSFLQRVLAHGRAESTEKLNKTTSEKEATPKEAPTPLFKVSSEIKRMARPHPLKTRKVTNTMPRPHGGGPEGDLPPPTLSAMTLKL
jgi:hypothetical protein